MSLSSSRAAFYPRAGGTTGKATPFFELGRGGIGKLERMRVTMKENREVCKGVGEGVGFERIRRITGYLVGTTDRFNNAKRAEEKDRVKHGLQTEN